MSRAEPPRRRRAGGRWRRRRRRVSSGSSPLLAKHDQRKITRAGGRRAVGGGPQQHGGWRAYGDSRQLARPGRPRASRGPAGAGRAAGSMTVYRIYQALPLTPPPPSLFDDGDHLRTLARRFVVCRLGLRCGAHYHDRRLGHRVRLHGSRRPLRRRLEPPPLGLSAASARRYPRHAVSPHAWHGPARTQS